MNRQAGTIATLSLSSAFFALGAAQAGARLESSIVSSGPVPKVAPAPEPDPKLGTRRYFPVSTPAITLVHIRNIHLTPDQDSDSPSAQIFRETQEQVLYIAKRYIAERKVDAIYTEGLTPTEITEYKAQVAARRKTLSIDNSGVGNIDSVSTLLSGAPESLAHFGGAAAVAVKFGIRAEPADDREFLNRCKTAEAIGAPNVYELIHTERENALLRRIRSDYPRAGAKSSVTGLDSIVLMTNFGAEHSFKDNVEAWNIANPDYPIELLEITPPTVSIVRGEDSGTRSRNAPQNPAQRP